MSIGPNVLITSAAAKVALVQRFKAAVSDYEGHVFTADIVQNCAAGFFAKKHFAVKPLSDQGALDEIVNICHEYRISLIVPTRDGELPFFADNKDFLATQGITVLVSYRENLDRVTDKSLFSEATEDAGFKAVPRIEHNLQSSDFPLFIRPKSGAGGVGTRRINNARDLPEDLSSYLLHPYLEAPEYSIDVLMSLDGSTHSKLSMTNILAYCLSRLIPDLGERQICLSKLDLILRNKLSI